jgi:uncharacterized small protein (DUF1192 family)
LRPNALLRKLATGGDEASMDDETIREKPDIYLAKIGKHDLYALSIGDLDQRIEALKAEIARCEAAKAVRGGARSEADKLFKF